MALNETRSGQRSTAGDGSPIDRCTYVFEGGRCCLRGQVGEWEKMSCSFHWAVKNAGVPHTKGEFSMMVNDDRARGYTFWDHKTLDEWWEKVCGRAPFPMNPKTALEAALERIAREKAGSKLSDEERQERHDLYSHAIRLAESFKVIPPEPIS